MTYEKKIDFSIKLLRNIPQDGPIELCYSGGKDSDVILELAKMAGIPFEAIYKQTSIDPPGTTAHAKENGVTIVRPAQTFLQLVERKGLASRHRRYCCEVLKEYKIHDRNVQGIRRSESPARARRYKEPEFCRLYPKGEKVRTYLPILEWTNEDVARFIEDRKIKCAPVYYDADGRFHVERRLGCIGCPLQADQGVADFRKYPKLLRNYARAFQKFLDNHVGTSYYNDMDGDAVLGLFYRLFCDTRQEFLDRKTGGLFPETALDIHDYMSNYFGIEL